MKNLLLLLFTFSITVTVFGQKTELKNAQKAIDANDFASAMTQIEKVEGLIANADQKTKAKFYYLKGLALYQNGSISADSEKVAEAFDELVKYESKTKKKYSTEILDLTNKLITSTAGEASNAYKTADSSKDPADYIEAAKKFHLVYKLSPRDTLYLDNAAIMYNRGKDYENSNELFKELLNINYTGITTIYTAQNKDDGEEVIFNNEKDMDMQVKFGVVINPRSEVKESRRDIVFKFLSENYAELEDLDSALEILSQGREEFPDSYDMLISEANIYFRKDNKAKFKELLEEAINLNPSDPSLYFNVGVMNLDLKNVDEAIANFEKAIEVDPNYGPAYQNIGTAIIDKTAAIVEEMNNSLSDFDKYDRLQAEQYEIYKEAIPYYEKAYEIDPKNVNAVQTLMSLYENLEMTEKFEELKAVYESIK